MLRSSASRVIGVLVVSAVLLQVESCSSDKSLSISQEARAFADEHWSSEKYLSGLYEVYYQNNQNAAPDDPYLDTIMLA